MSCTYFWILLSANYTEGNNLFFFYCQHTVKRLQQSRLFPQISGVEINRTADLISAVNVLLQKKCQHVTVATLIIKHCRMSPAVMTLLFTFFFFSVLKEKSSLDITGSHEQKRPTLFNLKVKRAVCGLVIQFYRLWKQHLMVNSSNTDDLRGQGLTKHNVLTRV